MGFVLGVARAVACEIPLEGQIASITRHAPIQSSNDSWATPGNPPGKLPRSKLISYYSEPSDFVGINIATDAFRHIISRNPPDISRY